MYIDMDGEEFSCHVVVYFGCIPSRSWLIDGMVNIYYSLILPLPACTAFSRVLIKLYLWTYINVFIY